MRRLYEKNQIRHFLVWLTIYLVISIVAINIGLNFGLTMHAAAIIPLGIFSLILFLYLRRTGIGREIGLGIAPAVSLGRMWFYLPALALVFLPLVAGLREDLTWFIAVTVVGWAVLVGFLEEVLMRGMLLKALLDTWKPIWAMLVTAFTFGLGHIASLAIGQSGIDTTLQIINATVVGLLFTLMVVATGNLHAVIVAHILYNAIATLSQSTDNTMMLIAGVIVLVVYGGWLLYGAGVKNRMRTIDHQRSHGPTDPDEKDSRPRPAL